MAGPSLRKGAGTPKWWYRPLGAVLVVVALALVVLIVATSGGSPANVSKHVLGAALVLALVGTFGVGLFLPKHALRFTAIAFWLVPAACIWVGVEHWLDWHEFYTTGGGRHSVRTQGGARVEGTFLVVVGVLGFALWAVVVRRTTTRRRSGTGA